MADYINAKLPSRVIVVTKGCDRVISIRRRDALGDPVDWGAGVGVYIDIDVSRSESFQVAGSIDGSLAEIRMESSVLDGVKTGTAWRVVMSEPGDPTLETAVLVGTFERNDGK